MFCVFVDRYSSLSVSKKCHADIQITQKFKYDIISINVLIIHINLTQLTILIRLKTA